MAALAKPTLEDVGVRCGLTLPLTEDQAVSIANAIEDATADVEAFLNRPLTVTSRTLAGIYPVFGADPDDWRAWPQFNIYDDRVTVVSWTANVDGTFDVTANIGLDGATEPSIVRAITESARIALLIDPNSGIGRRRIASVSAEGQSISYERIGSTRGGDPMGAAPTFDRLARFRRHAAYQSTRVDSTPWPYGIGYRG